MNTMNTALDAMADKACEEALKAAMTILRNMGWSNDEILQAGSEWLLPRLTAECKARLDEAVDDFREAMEAGMSAWATRAFVMTFIAAGIKVASEGHAEFRGTEDEEARMTRMAAER
jgi:ABC-type proline/glycine betaine transport system substrate-binding protein